MFKFKERSQRGVAWDALDVELEKWLQSQAAKDALAQLSASPPPVDAVSDTEDPVKASIQEKLIRARQRIQQLKEEADVRTELRAESQSQIDYQISKAAQSLEEFSLWGVGYNQGVDFRRNFLERQLAQFRKDRRESRLKAWQDMGSVRSDLRDALAEYYDLRRRYGLLGYTR